MSKNKKNTATVGTDWENEVKSFFNSLGFIVDGGPDFRPGGRQVDVVALKEGILFLIECKTKEEAGERGDLKSEIRKHRGRFNRIISALKEGYRGNKFQNFDACILLIATKDIYWTKEDFEELYKNATKENPRAQCILENVMNYYSDLAKNLSSQLAVYQMFSDFHLYVHKSKKTPIPAFKQEIGNLKVYHFLINPKELLPFVSVARRNSTRKGYYQRMVNGKRLKSIREYLSEVSSEFPQGKIIPGNIILSTNSEISKNKFGEVSYKSDASRKSNISKENSSVLLELPSYYGSLWVVDGQHRIYSFGIDTRKEPNCEKVLVTLIDGMNITQQGQLFVDINDKQKKVDQEYLIDLIGDYAPFSEDGILSNSIKILSREKFTGFYNIFYHNIKIPSFGSKGNFSMKSIYRALKRERLLTSEFLFDEIKNPFINDKNREEEKIKIDSYKIMKHISEYFDIVIKENTDKKLNNQYSIDKLLSRKGKDGIVEVFLDLYLRIIAAVKEREKKSLIPTKEDITQYILPIKLKLSTISSDEDFDSLINTVGDGPKQDTVKKLCSVIHQAGFSEFDFPDLDITFNRIVEEVQDLEKSLREMINEEMKKIDLNWCKGKNTNLLRGELYNLVVDKLKTEMSMNQEFIQEGKWYEGMDLGNCINLIEQHWSTVFSKIFVEGSRGFVDKSQVISSLLTLSKYRSTRLHRKEHLKELEILKDPNQKALASNYLVLFNKVMASLNIDELVEEDIEEDSESSE